MNGKDVTYEAPKLTRICLQTAKNPKYRKI